MDKAKLGEAVRFCHIICGLEVIFGEAKGTGETRDYSKRLVEVFYTMKRLTAAYKLGWILWHTSP